jgi:hypothetical protein
MVHICALVKIGHKLGVKSAAVRLGVPVPNPLRCRDRPAPGETLPNPGPEAVFDNGGWK